MAKIGFEQLNNPAPLWYKRILNWFIILQIPLQGVLTTLNAEDVLSDKAYTITLQVIVFVISAAKALQQVLGAEPEQTIIENNTGEEIPPK